MESKETNLQIKIGKGWIYDMGDIARRLVDADPSSYVLTNTSCMPDTEAHSTLIVFATVAEALEKLFDDLQETPPGETVCYLSPSSLLVDRTYNWQTSDPKHPCSERFQIYNLRRDADRTAAAAALQAHKLVNSFEE